MSNTTKRILYIVVLIFSLYLLPWYITVGLSLVGMFAFNHFAEAIVFGVAIDMLFGVPLFEFGWSIFFSVSMIIAFLIIEKLKTRLRFYAI